MYVNVQWGERVENASLYSADENESFQANLLLLSFDSSGGEDPHNAHFGLNVRKKNIDTCVDLSTFGQPLHEAQAICVTSTLTLAFIA